MQTKLKSEHAARVAARRLPANTLCQIVESNHNPKEGRHDPAPVFYLETEPDISMIRNWERLVFSGSSDEA